MTDTTTAGAGTAGDVLPLPLTAGQWALDPLHSTAGFSIRHLGVSKVRGRFNAFDATLHVGQTVDDLQVTAVIEVASIDTGNADRDAHVRTPEYLDVDSHPEMRFTSTRITGSDGDWVLEGEATIHGVTRPFAFDVEFGGLGDFMGRQHAGFSAAGELRRSDFGLEFSPPANLGLGAVVRFELDLQFAEPLPD